MRDSIHTGVEYGKFDYLRLIDTLRVLEEPERISGESLAKEDSRYQTMAPQKEYTLGIDVGGIHAAEGLILARYFMFTQVYFHRTRRVFDYHLVDYLKDCLPDSVFPSGASGYLEYNDVKILDSLFNEEKDNIHRKRLLDREHLRNVRDITKEEIAERKDALDDLRERLEEKIGEDNFVIDSSRNTPYDAEAPTFPVYDAKTPETPITDIKNKSEVIKSLPEKIDIIRIYSEKEKKDEVNEIVNDVFKGGSDG